MRAKKRCVLVVNSYLEPPSPLSEILYPSLANAKYNTSHWPNFAVSGGIWATGFSKCITAFNHSWSRIHVFVSLYFSFTATDSTGREATPIALTVILCDCSGRGTCQFNQLLDGFVESDRFQLVQCLCPVEWIGKCSRYCKHRYFRAAKFTRMKPYGAYLPVLIFAHIPVNSI